MMTQTTLSSKSSFSRSILRTLFMLLILLLASSELLRAQPTPPDDPNSAPIDGGLSLMVGAGAAVAAWKYRAAAKAKRP